MRERTLKPGWKIWRFDQMAENVKDTIARPVDSGLERYVGLEHLDTNSLKIWRWGSTSDVEKSKLLFRKGDIIFGRRNAYLRRVAIADFDGVCSAHALVLRAKPEVALPEFLPFFMQTDGFWEAALKVSAGSMSPTINWPNIAKQEFALPLLEQQRRIAELLMRVETALESFLALSSKADLLFESTTEELLSSVMKNGNCELADKADVRYGITVNQTRRNASNTIPYLRVANVQRGQLDLSEIKEIGYFDSDEELLLRQGDVLIVEGHATSTEVGRSVLWNCEIERCTHQNHLIRVRVDDSIDPRFLVLYLNSTFGRKYFSKHVKSTSGLNTINSTVVRNLPIPTIGIEQQRYFVEVTNNIRSQSYAVMTRNDAIKKLKSHLLMELS